MRLNSDKELVAVNVLVPVIFLGYISTWLRVAERGLGRFARRKGFSITLVGLLALTATATLSLVWGIPRPQVHDEFSYLLAADTFASGRLSNPTHPLWMHFESFHIIQQPTYASKYPPAQGLMLAIGQIIGGHPIVGVWISMGLAYAALCWMLLAWLPPWWALAGSLVAALHPSILIAWGYSYWGGSVAMLGGALLFGALRRIVRQPRARDSALLGIGLAVLANSRPYEGLVASLPAGIALLAWMVSKNGPCLRISIRQIVIPSFLILALTAAAMAVYNLRVTGNAVHMPYFVHESTYAVAPSFLWQHPRPEPTYRHEAIRSLHLGWELDAYARQQSVEGFVRETARKVRRLWSFYGIPKSITPRIGFGSLWPLLAVPLMMLWVLRQHWPRFALVTCTLVGAALAMETFFSPHYAAPIVGLVFVLGFQVLRHVHIWRWRCQPVGRFIVWTILIVGVASFIAAFPHLMPGRTAAWAIERGRIVEQLEEMGGHHLVIVRYSQLAELHQEWVYNKADIDTAPVVWARDMDIAQNRKLLQYFGARQVWLLEVDQKNMPPKLVPYSIELRPL
jgi:hypothetical protein